MNAAGEWQDIATAPKDGTVVLLFIPDLKSGFVLTASWRSSWRDGDWHLVQAGDYATSSNVDGVPTLWAPINLPALP